MMLLSVVALSVVALTIVALGIVALGIVALTFLIARANDVFPLACILYSAQ